MAVLLVCAAVVAVACDRTPQARLEVEVPWALGGAWMVIDTHSHTRFSDGGYPPDEVVNSALLAGCNALAITDHAEKGQKTATPAYFAEIKKIRERLPEFVLFAGIEWNVPPYRGREHATLLVHPDLEQALLPEFMMRFDSFDNDVRDARPALEWLDGKLKDRRQALMIYNHPSRRDTDVTENLADMRGWRAASPLFVAFEGGPGHQKGNARGVYGGRIPTQDRWDPVVAAVGGVWDTLLDGGENLWGALAVSDYHEDANDHVPCAFARTHVQVPERTAWGVLQGLRSGSFWADHGTMLRSLSFTVRADGLALSASPGETVLLAPGQAVEARLALVRAANASDSSLDVEIIGNCGSGKPGVLAASTLGPADSEQVHVISSPVAGADGSSCYVRARVAMNRAADDRLFAYTNPVRLRLKPANPADKP